MTFWYIMGGMAVFFAGLSYWFMRDKDSDKD